MIILDHVNTHIDSKVLAGEWFLCGEPIEFMPRDRKPIVAKRTYGSEAFEKNTRGL